MHSLKWPDYAQIWQTDWNSRPKLVIINLLKSHTENSSTDCIPQITCFKTVLAFVAKFRRFLVGRGRERGGDTNNRCLKQATDFNTSDWSIANYTWHWSAKTGVTSQLQQLMPMRTCGKKAAKVIVCRSLYITWSSSQRWITIMMMMMNWWCYSAVFSDRIHSIYTHQTQTNEWFCHIMKLMYRVNASCMQVAPREHHDQIKVKKVQWKR